VSIGVLAISVSAAAAAADPPRELRVCADPDNLPFSNDKLEGFENKIADVIAKELNAAVRYTWHPQRGAFFRKTLKASLCDVVIGVPAGLDDALTTKPYYRSTYVFVTAKPSKLDLHSFDDPALRKLKIGVHAVGDDGVNLPPVHSLARRGLSRNLVAFTILHTNDSPPGKIVDAVAARQIDTAVVWGPMAGYFAKHEPVEMQLTPVSPPIDGPVPFTYEISLGVRPGDTARKQQLEGVLDHRAADIRKVLEDFGVPLVAAPGVSTADSAHPLKN
jgi:quinoprotein dehydrogenase-associated probable ABC transporter substrate-binding protein